jgi:hypothetical protein
MRCIVLLLSSTLVFAQTPGKPGVTDPIKDPRQIPGNPNPGPIPRATPQPEPPAPEKSRSRKKAKKTKTPHKTEKVNPPAR